MIKWRRSIFCYLAGYEGLSIIEIERGGGRRCDLCVVRWSAAGVVWM